MPPNAVVQHRKARQVLGWQAQVSSDEGLQRTIEWFRTVMSHALASA